MGKQDRGKIRKSLPRNPKKRLLSLAIVVLVVVLLVFGTFGVLRAINRDYNRSYPLMDYVPQEIGIYDTTYENLTESDCRGCHGNSLADRHHATSTVVRDRNCTACHEVDVNAPGGVLVVRDCTTNGCHSQYDLDTNGWHHNTDLSGSGNCIGCHDPSLIAQITPFRDFSLYPPSVVTPTPFSCENCHFEQAASVTGNPDSPGHPSTYDHATDTGEFTGFYEYGKPIYGNSDTHHMNFLGNVSSECSQCHTQNPSTPSWDPYDPLLIRYCEICHSAASLHSIGPHVQNSDGWEAVGFHVPYGNTDSTDFDPLRYRTWQATGPYLPEVEPGFTADQQCFGCHGDRVPQPPPPPSSPPPVLDDSSAGIRPSHGCCGVLVALRGSYFGNEKAKGFTVQLNTGDCSDPLNSLSPGGEGWGEGASDPPGQWIDMPVHAWADTLIEFEIPCWILLEHKNYNVRVVTPAGESNKRVFTVEDCIPPLMQLNPDAGQYGTWIKVSLLSQGSGSFGSSRSEIFDDGYHGVYRLVDFVSSQGTYTALDYRNWSNESFEVRAYDFFKDIISPDTGQRNFIQDSDVADPEPAISKGYGLAQGTWTVSVKFIYFGDEDHNGVFSAGDIIFQIVTSDALYFELVNVPTIYWITPDKVTNGNSVKIIGLNFGTSQSQGKGEVRIGSKEEAQNPDPDTGTLQGKVQSWSSTQINVKVNAPSSWTGQYKYLWIEKNKVKSNSAMLKILAPLP
jgi:hypothetical protein